MHFRHHALLLLACVALGACGDDPDADAAQVRRAVEQYFAHDPAGCERATRGLVANLEDQPDQRAAVQECRERRAKPIARIRADGGAAPSRAAVVSRVVVHGTRATAAAKLEGGALDGHTMRVTLARHADGWKIDALDGYPFDDDDRRRMEQLLRVTFRHSLRNEVAADEIAPTVDCIIARGRIAFPNAQFSARYEGKLSPGSVSNAFSDVAFTCLSDDARSAKPPRD